MYKISDLVTLIDQIAPLSLSYKLIERGSYDNSGLLVKLTDSADKILFSLDLSVCAVLYAIDNGCDTIITHHPAIYSPIKEINIDNDKALALAVKNGLNVISMHLNLDVALDGIDASLCQGLGGRDIKIIEIVDSDCGYGRLATVKEQSLDSFASSIAKEFGSQKIICYGDKPVKNVASFCGSGASTALEYLSALDDADTMVTSDISHHQLKELVENGKNVVIIPHYVSEQYGYKKFYDLVSKKLDKKAQTLYFLDNRFM